MTVTSDESAEVSAPIVAAILRRLCGQRRSEAHESVVDREIGTSTGPLAVRNELPAAFRQKAMIAAGNQLGSVREPDPIRRLDGAPVRQHSGANVAAIVPALLRAVDLLAGNKVGQRLGAAIHHENLRVPGQAIDATMLAAAIRIDRLIERNVRRVVARDDRARRFRLHDRGERRQFFVETAPAVVDGFAARRLEAPGRIRHRAAPGACARSVGRSHGPDATGYKTSFPARRLDAGVRALSSTPVRRPRARARSALQLQDQPPEQCPHLASWRQPESAGRAMCRHRR